MPIWRDFKPTLKRQHSWLFAHYSEFPSERSDNKWYDAFLFRNEERTLFGIAEFVGENPHDGRLFESMAKKVVADSEYRKSLLTDNKDVRKWWKRH